MFVSLAKPHYSVEVVRAYASHQAAEEERKEDQRRWGWHSDTAGGGALWDWDWIGMY